LRARVTSDWGRAAGAALAFHNREGKNVSFMRKLSKHPKSSETRIASVRIRAYEFEWDARPSS